MSKKENLSDHDTGVIPIKEEGKEVGLCRERL